MNIYTVHIILNNIKTYILNVTNSVHVTFTMLIGMFIHS